MADRIARGPIPVWARNGAELFYRDKNKMMVVAVTIEPTFRPDNPRMLFEKASKTNYWSDIVAQYDVSPDGRRFLMVEPVEPVKPPKSRWYKIGSKN